MSDFNIPESKWNGFFHFNVGHLLILIGMMGSGFWWFVTYDREFNRTKSSVDVLVITVDKLATKVDTIDETGTHYSHRDDSLANMNSERLIKLEGQFEKIDRIAMTLDDITSWVKEQKQVKNK